MLRFSQEGAVGHGLSELKQAAIEGGQPISLSGMSRALHRADIRQPGSRKRKRYRKDQGLNRRNVLLSVYPFRLQFDSVECCEQQCVAQLQDSTDVEALVKRVLQANSESEERAAMIDALIAINAKIGHHICHKGSKSLLAISESRHRKWCTAINGNLTDAFKGHARANIPPSNKLPTQLIESVRHFIQEHLVDVPERDARYWPQHIVTLEGWAEFFRLETQLQGKSHVFASVLKEDEFANVHPMPQSWWKCSTCVAFSVKRTDLHHQRKKNPNMANYDQQMRTIEQDLSAHIRLVSTEWSALKSITLNVRNGLWWDGTSRTPDDFVLVLQVDHKNRVTVPKLRQSPQTLDMLEKVAVRMYGIVNDVTDACHLLLYNDEVDGQNWRHILSMLGFYLNEIETIPPPGTGRRHLSIRFDNCGKENKNHFVMNWAAYVIMIGKFDSVGFHCPPVGHTKDKCDRKFGVFSRLYHLGDVVSMHDCQELGSTIKSTTGLICPSRIFFNWEEFIALNFREKLPGISKKRHFLITKDLSSDNKVNSIQLKWKKDWSDEWEDQIQLFPKSDTTSTLIRGSPDTKMLDRRSRDEFKTKIEAFEKAKKYVPNHLRQEYDQEIELIKSERAKFQSVTSGQKKSGASAQSSQRSQPPIPDSTNQSAGRPTLNQATGILSTSSLPSQHSAVNNPGPITVTSTPSAGQPRGKQTEPSNAATISIRISADPPTHSEPHNLVTTGPQSAAMQTLQQSQDASSSASGSSSSPRASRLPILPDSGLQLVAGGFALIDHNIFNKSCHQGGCFDIKNFRYTPRTNAELSTTNHDLKFPH